LFRDLKLYGPLCFLLYDDRALRDQAAVADIAYAQLYQVTRPQFAVDREIEKGKFSYSPPDLEANSNRPNIFQF